MYILYLNYKPIVIVDVFHDDYGYAHVVVSNYPLFDQDRINWWLSHKDLLKSKYNIPTPEAKDWYHVLIWNIGDGYLKATEKNIDDLYCFDNNHKKCIDKDMVLQITGGRDGEEYNIRRTRYKVINGNIVQLQPWP